MYGGRYGLLGLEALFDFLFGPVDGSGPGRRLPRKGEVPDLRGMRVDEARRVLAREGFKADVRTLDRRPAPVMGFVVEQRPTPGTRWTRTRRIRVDVSHPPSTRADDRRARR
jgi:hypothetical protein